MAKFFIECPHCGTSNQASTFIFAKKIIECGHCKQSIDVKANRITSRKCPHCKTIFLFDQKNETNECPSCKRSIGARFGKLVSFACPECGCGVETSEGTKTCTCPVCDREIDVAKEVAKSKLVTDETISVIQYEGDNSTFVWKHPIENFNYGSQLIVRESQEAVFLLNGQALDTFGAGKYTLETESFPSLKKAQDMSTGKQNPFCAEVYFINQTTQTEILWGVGGVSFREPTYDLLIQMGLSGKMNIQVSNSRKLLFKIVGTTKGISWESNDSIAKSLKPMFLPLIKSVVMANLPSIIKSKGIDVLEISEASEKIAEQLRQKISDGMEEFGLKVPQFYINDFRFEEDENFKRLKKFTTEKVVHKDIEFEKAKQLAAQEAKKDILISELDFDKIAAEKKRIQAQSDSDVAIIKANTGIEIRRREGMLDVELGVAQSEVIREKGMAVNDVARQRGLGEAQIMDAKHYTQRDVLNLKEKEAQWNAIGEIGSKAGGGVGNGGIISDVMQVGVTLGTIGAVSEKVSDVMGGLSGKDNVTKETTVIVNNPEAANAPAAVDASASANTWDCACGHIGNTGKFCSECGKPKPEAWDCPNCGAKGNKGKFCSECGAAKPEAWDCPNCGAKGNKGKFCSECGKPKDAEGGWNCSCGKKNITSKFCPECGAPKETK